MAEVNEYAPDQVLCAWLGEDILGFANGTFIEVEFNADTFTMDVGAHGDVTRVQSHDQSGTITLTLMQGSQSNDRLSQRALTDRKDRSSKGAFFIKDKLGTTLVSAETAWIRKQAGVSLGTDAQTRQWVFDCAKLVMFTGGQTVL